MSNGNGKVMTLDERQSEINDNLLKTCKYILVTLDCVHQRLDIVQKRLSRLETFAKRSVKDATREN